uniref:Uncharacterized protein n=1 Tax=Sphenodon punctatus TaxID=8508 RepID=A0A8D0GEB7_SPHPU
PAAPEPDYEPPLGLTLGPLPPDRDPSPPDRPHRWLPLVGGGRRHPRGRSPREHESPEAEPLPHAWKPWRYLRVPGRDASNCSSPERGGSDCSSDHEDGSSSDFNYGVEEFDAEGNEEPKVPPGGSETMPYIDESPTMSPQLSARGQDGGGGDGGGGISPTPADGSGTGVGGHTGG